MSDRAGREGRPGPYGLPCPECGALRAPDNTPSCACAQRAADALRDTRAAEAAAAEDFDPLRIRPYVELDEGTEADGQGAGQGAGQGDVPADDAAVDETMELRAIRPNAPTAHPNAPAAHPAAIAPLPKAAPPADPTVTLPRARLTAPEPDPADLSLFETTKTTKTTKDTATGPGSRATDGHREDEYGPPSRGRRRRVLLIAASGAAVAVIAVAGFAGGLFSYEAPKRDSAAPEDVRAAVPDTSTSAAAASESASGSPSASASSPAPSVSAAERPSPSAPERSSSPSATTSVQAGAASPSTRASDTAEPGTGSDGSQETVTPPVLRRGDTGAEVTELQERLHQLFLYNGAIDGTFSTDVETSVRNYQSSRGIQEDELGVYGAATRTSLESETKEP